MTQEEEKSVIGGVVVEYDQVKKRLVALESAGRTAAQVLNQIEVALRNPLQTPIKQLLAHIDKMSPPDKLRELVAEIEENQQRKSQLEKTMRDYGLNLPWLFFTSWWSSCPRYRQVPSHRSALP